MLSCRAQRRAQLPFGSQSFMISRINHLRYSGSSPTLTSTWYSGSSLIFESTSGFGVVSDPEKKLKPVRQGHLRSRRNIVGLGDEPDSRLVRSRSRPRESTTSGTRGRPRARKNFLKKLLTSLFENAIELKKFNLLVINFHKILGGKEVSSEGW